jgi:hypothetical protein
MNPASSEARNATIPGMSSGCPTRSIGIARTSAVVDFLAGFAFAEKAAFCRLAVLVGHEHVHLARQAPADRRTDRPTPASH